MIVPEIEKLSNWKNMHCIIKSTKKEHMTGFYDIFMLIDQ